jgi:hypothetical protein
MLTLYYASGACSTASHIGLEESGAPYEARPISFADGEQRSEAYLRINPRGREHRHPDLPGKAIPRGQAPARLACG